MESENIKNKSQTISGIDLDIITNRLIIEGIIRLESQMHIGVGEENIEFSPESGILMTRIGTENKIFFPYIPKSSIKGILRSEAERIAKAFSKLENNPKYICKNYPEHYCKVEQNDNSIEPCVICKIFGGEDLASHIIFSDGIPTKETKNSFKTKLKPGIAINRKKQVSKDGSLFFIETLQPGAEFKFEMIINNISKETKPLEYKIVRTLFKMIKLGFLSIGGHRSTGMGKFIIIDPKIKELKHKDDFLYPDEVESIDLYDYFEI